MTEAVEAVKTYAQVDSSRIRIVNTPTQLPGVCCVCGASRSDDRQYVDIGIDVDYVGTMYFCTFCLTEAVNALGCLTKEQSDSLVDELNSARQTILDFQQEKAALDGAVDTLRRTGLFSGTDFSSVIHSDEVLEPEPGNIQDVIPTEPKPARSSKNTKQSDSKPGSNDLPEPGSDDFTKLIQSSSLWNVRFRRS